MSAAAGEEARALINDGVRHLFAAAVLQAIKDYRLYGDWKKVKTWLLEDAPLWYEAAGAAIDPDVWEKWVEDGCPMPPGENRGLYKGFK